MAARLRPHHPKCIAPDPCEDACEDPRVVAEISVVTARLSAVRAGMPPAAFAAAVLSSARFRIRWAGDPAVRPLAPRPSR